MKSADRLRWLVREVPSPKGTYLCTVPGCSVKQGQDGFCSAHPQVPLRLTKPRP